MAWQKKWIPEEEKSADIKKANARAAWYLSGRDHAEQELYEKLCRGFTPEAAAAAVGQMCEYGYLNDARYAQQKAQSLLCAHKSKREITHQLAQKGVDRVLIAQTLERLYETEADMNADEDAALCDPEIQSAYILITRRYARKLEQGREDLVIAALARRGFSYGTIRQALAAHAQQE